ncbi:MAG: S8 family serine peptidase [Candidatus Bathyarchaeia archaeon]
MNYVGVFLVSMLLISVLNVVFAIRSFSNFAIEDDVYGGDSGFAAILGSDVAEGLSAVDSGFFFGDFADGNSASWGAYANRWGENGFVRLVVGVRSRGFQDFMFLDGLVVKDGGRVVDFVSLAGGKVALVVDVPVESVASFRGEALALDLVRYVEASVRFEAQLVPGDPYWSLQWGPRKIEADWAWNTTVGSDSVLVAVVDTGIDWSHPDLAANYVPLGRDWVNRDFDPLDDHGHGTHVAGIIAAVIDNGVGIAGLAQVRVMAEKGLDQYGSGNDYQLANAIIHAADQGADIISMSWGSSESSQVIYDAIRYAYDAGVLLVASAGNQATSMKMYPAAYDEVLAIAATDQSDIPAYFSNFGDWIELAAPGVSVYSTMPTYWVTMNDWGYAMNYDYLSGTSMACPHVAGVAALMLSQFPNVTRDWVKSWLRYTADDLGQTGFDERYGYGRVNARKGVVTVPPVHELMFVEVNTPPYVEPETVALINGTVFNFGSVNETDVEVQLFVNGSMVDSTVLGFIQSYGESTAYLEWNPVTEGRYNVTVYIVPVPGETDSENNVFSTFVYVGVPLKAVVLDSAGTDLAEVIATWRVLNTNWDVFGDTLIYIDYLTLNKEDISYEDIAATEADVLIISCAYQWEFADAEIDAVGRYVMEGHGLVATAGTFWYMVPNNNKLARLFGMSETTTWYGTTTDLLEVEEASHPLFEGIPSPFVFPQTGTALPHDGVWDSNELAGGEYVARGSFKESAVVTNRGLVYLSPWLEIMPARYHHHLQLLYNAITWSSYERPEHELVVSLDAPTYSTPEETVLLNATVYNLGLSNEANVELYLTIDNTTVNSTTISELPAGENWAITYLWTPLIEGYYNVTAYAPAVPGEETTVNNRATVLTVVSRPMINPLEGQYANYTIYWGLGFFYVDYLEYVAPYLVNITMTSVGDGYSYSSWIVVSTLDRKVVAPSSANETYYPYWIETNITIGSTVRILDTIATVIDSEPVQISNRLVDCWKLSMTYYDYNYSLWFDKTSGVMVLLEGVAEGYVSGAKLADTNIPIGWVEYDLAVSVEAPDYIAPGTSVSLEATVYNTGLNNMTDVQLYLLIDGSTVAFSFVPELVVGDSYSISYLWSPPWRATYNITAYVPPEPEETFVANNAVSKLIEVRRPLINPVEGQWANYTARVFNGSSEEIALEQEWRFEYGPYLTPWLINTSIAVSTGGVNASQLFETTYYYLAVDIMDRFVNAGSMSWWVGTWYVGWIETNVDLGSSLNWWTDSGTVVGDRAIRVGDMTIDCWEVYGDFIDFSITAWYDKESGLLVGWDERSKYSRGNITLTATNVPIGSAAFVDRCYRDLHFREAEPEGLAFWVGELESGRITRAGFVEAVFNSEEYQNNWGNRLFVALMYDGVFERVPDQGGYDHYVAALNSGAMTWNQMLEDWLNSTEWEARFGEQSNVEFVTKLYRGMLHREPDAEGLDFWVGKLETGEFTRAELIIHAFYECLEYQMVNPEEKLVYQLYLGLLRRTPETEGYKNWVGALHAGMAKHDVINEFLTCPEYKMIHLTP